MPKQRGTAVTLDLYDAEDNVMKHLSRVTIPFGVLKLALKLNEELDTENISESDLDAIVAVVVEVFGGAVTADELYHHADSGDMLAVFTQIAAKAANLLNPTAPPGR